MRIAITLVHGTFAPNAEWTLEGSFFRRELERRMTADLTIETLSWSGANRFSARAEAAARLQRQLRDAVALEPNVQRVIIGHSHGGNIALYAIRNRVLADRVRVVCLSTPFILARERRFSSAQETAIRFVSAAFLLVGLAASLFWFGYLLFEILRYFIASTSEVLILMPLISLPFVFPRLWRSWQERERRAPGEFEYPDIPRENLLLLRMAGDEAASGLGAAHTASWVAAKLSRFLNTLASLPSVGLSKVGIRILSWFFGARAADPDFRRLAGTRVAYGALVMIWAGCLSVALPETFQERIQPFIFGLPMAIGALAIVPVIMGAFVAVPALGIMVLTAGVFGVDLAHLALSLEFSVEPAPPGDWRVIEYPWPSEANTRGLLHSALYNHDAAIERIARFIVETDTQDR